MQTEVWRQIPGISQRFLASSNGRIKTQPHEYTKTTRDGKLVIAKLPGRILTQTVTRSGYLTVNIGHGGKCKTALVHRLIAMAFLDAPDGSVEVNHKNGIKHDNSVANLEWVSRSENVLHSYRKLGHKRPSKQAVRAVAENGSELIFLSMLEAAKVGGFTLSAVGRCVKAVGGFHKGYRWYGVTAT